MSSLHPHAREEDAAGPAPLSPEAHAAIDKALDLADPVFDDVALLSRYPSVHGSPGKIVSTPSPREDRSRPFEHAKRDPYPIAQRPFLQYEG